MKTSETVEAATPPAVDRDAIQAAVKSAAKERNEVMGKLHALKSRIESLTVAIRENQIQESETDLATLRPQVGELQPQVDRAIARYDALAKQLHDFDEAALEAKKKKLFDSKAPPAAKPNVLTRIVRAIDRALSATPKKTGFELTATVLLDISGQHSVIVSEFAESIGTLRRLQAEHTRAFEVLNRHTDTAARDSWLSHRESVLQQAIQSEQLHIQSGWSRGEWEAEFEEMREAAKDEMKRIHRLALPLCVPIVERFVVIAKQQADSREEHDIEAHERFGIPYPGASAVTLALRKTIEIARSRVQSSDHGNASPAQMLPFLEIW